MDSISEEVLEELPEEARDYIERLEKEIERLKGLLRMNSQNSSKPPSSDIYKKNVISGSQRLRSGKKQGGQLGHKGSTLKPVKKPDQVITHTVPDCAHCNHDLSGVNAHETKSTQVFDLPVTRIHITEHRAEVKCCPECDGVTQAEFPEGIAPVTVQYGANLKGFALYLLDQQLIPSRRVSQIVAGILGRTFSIGSLLKWQKEAFLKLKNFENELMEKLIAVEVLHLDETGMRAMGSRHWLHAASTETLTFFGIHKKRGVEAMNEFGILPRFRGIAIHDHWDSYFTFEACLHGLCNSHILRELKFLAEEAKEPWAKKMAELLSTILSSVKTEKERGKDKISLSMRLGFLGQYEAIMKQGFRFHLTDESHPSGKRGRKKQTKGKNLLDRLRDFNGSVLMFMNNFRVPFTNNQGERDIRMNKVKQKISGCFRSISGAQHFCRIRSYLSTIHKHGQCTLEAAVAIFKSEPLTLSQLA